MSVISCGITGVGGGTSKEDPAEYGGRFKMSTKLGEEAEAPDLAELGLTIIGLW